MDNIVVSYATQIVTIFQNVINTYEYNEDNIRRIEGELQDILHEIELTNSKDMFSGYKLYKEIRELRIERRKCKNENELLRDMYEYFKGDQAQHFKNKIQQVQGSSTKIANMQENRTYTPKQRNDLTCTDKHSEAVKPFEELMSEFKKTKVHMEKGKMRK